MIWRPTNDKRHSLKPTRVFFLREAATAKRRSFQLFQLVVQFEWGINCDDCEMAAVPRLQWFLTHHHTVLCAIGDCCPY